MNKTVLLRPVMTEKSMHEAQTGWYTFLVSKTSTKPDVVREVEQEFKVHVVDIKTIMGHGSVVRSGKRGLKSRSPDYKKALVRLSDKETIGVFQVESAPKK